MVNGRSVEKNNTEILKNFQNSIIINYENISWNFAVSFLLFIIDLYAILL